MVKNECRTIVVLGPPRSGTSLLSGILSEMGIKMHGEEIPTAVNPQGCFEDREFALLNKSILQKACGKRKYKPGDFWLNPPKYENIIKAEKYFNNQIKNLIKKRSNKLWGWKEPTTSLIIRLYEPHLVNPIFFVSVRDHFDIYSSVIGTNRYDKSYMKNKSGFIATKSDELIILERINYIYTLIYKFLIRSKHPYVLVQYNKLIKYPIKESERLAKILKITLSEMQKKQIHKLVIPRSKIAQKKKHAYFGLMIKYIVRDSKNLLSKVKNTIIRNSNI